MNRLRGDTGICLNGERYTLRLTLGALAEIEEALGVSDLTALTARLGNPAAGDILKILEVLLKTAGNPVPPEDLKNADFHLKELIRAVSEAFSAVLTGAGEAAESTPGKQAR